MTRGRLLTAALLATALMASTARADQGYPYDGMVVVATQHSYDALSEKVKQVVQANGMAIVTTASASAGAANRGVKIPGNVVFGVFRNDFAVRMLAASVPAGIEAPLRVYVTEGADGKATLTYRRPSAVFKAYGGGDLDAIGNELDAIFQKIAAEAAR